MVALISAEKSLLQQGWLVDEMSVEFQSVDSNLETPKY
jgi:hypothetical protein